MKLRYFVGVLLALVLTTWAFEALAQRPPPGIHPCTGLPITGPPYYVDMEPAKPTECVGPTPPLGIVDANAAGGIWWQYCRRPDGSYYPRWRVLPWDDLKRQPALALALTAAGLRADEAAMNAVMAQYAGLVKPLDDRENAAIWCPPMWDKIAAGIPPPAASAPPAPSAFVVAKNGSLTTRPTFLMTGSVRSTTSNGSAVVGVDCTGQFVQGPYTWGYPAGGPASSVTLCVPRPR